MVAISKRTMTALVLSCMLTSIISALDSDVAAIQKLRDTCGTYFGATIPISNLSSITSTQITSKLASTDFASIYSSTAPCLLSNAASFFSGTTYLTEITNFQATIKAAIGAQSSALGIANLNLADILAQVNLITDATSSNIKTAIASRISVLYDSRSTNATKESLTALLNVLKAAQIKFSTDSSYTGKALQTALEAAAFEPNILSATLTVLCDQSYQAYAKTSRTSGSESQQRQLSTDQYAYNQISYLCTPSQIVSMSADTIGQLLPLLQGAASFFSGASQSNDVLNLAKNCQLQQSSIAVLANPNATTIGNFITTIISNPDYDSPAFVNVFQTIYQICSNKLLSDLTALVKLTPVTLSSLTSVQAPQDLSAIIAMLTQAKNKNFMNFSGNITIANQSFNPGDENSPNSAKNAISNLIVSTQVLKALSVTDNAGRLAELKSLADSLASVVSPNAVSVVSQTIFGSAVLSVAKAANIISSDSTLQALMVSATSSKLITEAIKNNVIGQLTPATTTAVTTPKTTARGGRGTTAKTTTTTKSAGRTTAAARTGGAIATGTRTATTTTTRGRGR